MRTDTKTALAAIWIVAAGLIGVLGNVTSMGAGALVLSFGLLPPLLMLRGSTVRVHDSTPTR